MTDTLSTEAPEGLRAASDHRLRLLLLVALLLGAGLLWLRQQQAPPSAPEKLPPELRDEPDLFIDNPVIHQFNADGTRKYLLQAETINHFENQALTQMQQPDLRLSGRNDPWQATAETGDVRKQRAPGGELEEVVRLRDNVVLSQALPPPRYLSVQTMALSLFPDREFVETDESVIIDTHTGRTTATAMSGDLKTGVLHLSGGTNRTGNTTQKNQVKTIVLPSQFK